MELAERAERRRAEFGVPAIATAVIRGDGVEPAVVGLRRAGSAEPATIADRFHIGSNTKAMTATLAAIFVERGLVDWDTGAGGVLGIDGAHPQITLYRLLTHAAGVRPLALDEDIDALAVVPGAPVEERAAAARILLEDRPRFEPGTAHEYSNGGYVVAASMLERVAAGSWEDLLRAEIFELFQLDAGFGWPGRRGAPHPWGHRDVDGELRPHDPDGDYHVGAVIAPAGDVNATIASYAEFVRLHLRGLRGERSLLEPRTFVHLHTPDDGFASGWGVQQFEGATTSVHSGSAETFYAVVVLQAGRDLAVTTVANAANDRAQRAVVELTRELVRAYGA